MPSHVGRLLAVLALSTFPAAPSPAVSPPAFPADHHGCVEAFTGTVIALDVVRDEEEEDRFLTVATVRVEEIFAGIPADTLLVSTANSLKFHRDGFLDGYQDAAGGLVWFRPRDRVFIVAPLRDEDGTVDVHRPFPADYARFLPRSPADLGQPVQVVVGYSVERLLDGDRPRNLSEGVENLMSEVSVELVESGEILGDLADQAAAFDRAACGRKLFHPDSPFAVPAGRWSKNLARPRNLAVTGGGEILIVDESLHEVQRFRPDGALLQYWGGYGTGRGRFLRPTGIAEGPDGSLFVADQGNHRVQVFDPGGAPLRSWGAEGDGPGEFRVPARIDVGPDSTVYVLDHRRACVQAFASAGDFLRQWGSPGEGPGEFDSPLGLTVGPEGAVYVSDTGGRIQKFSPEGSLVLAWGGKGSGPGEFQGPADLAADPAGRILVADTYNYRVQAFDPDGGFLGQWGSAGAGNEARWYPWAIEAGPDSTVTVIGEHDVRRFRIR